MGALACLTALVTHHGSAIGPAALEPVLEELPALLDESDMHVSQVGRARGLGQDEEADGGCPPQVSVALLTRVATASTSSLLKVSSSVLPRVIELVWSPLLQGAVLATIQDFLQALLLTSDLGYR